MDFEKSQPPPTNPVVIPATEEPKVVLATVAPSMFTPWEIVAETVQFSTLEEYLNPGPLPAYSAYVDGVTEREKTRLYRAGQDNHLYQERTRESAALKTTPKGRVLRRRRIVAMRRVLVADDHPKDQDDNHLVEVEENPGPSHSDEELDTLISLEESSTESTESSEIDQSISLTKKDVKNISRALGNSNSKAKKAVTNAGRQAAQQVKQAASTARAAAEQNLLTRRNQDYEDKKRLEKNKAVEAKAKTHLNPQLRQSGRGRGRGGSTRPPQGGRGRGQTPSNQQAQQRVQKAKKGDAKLEAHCSEMTTKLAAQDDLIKELMATIGSQAEEFEREKPLTPKETTEFLQDQDLLEAHLHASTGPVGGPPDTLYPLKKKLYRLSHIPEEFVIGLVKYNPRWWWFGEFSSKLLISLMLLISLGFWLDDLRTSIVRFSNPYSLTEDVVTLISTHSSPTVFVLLLVLYLIGILGGTYLLYKLWYLVAMVANIIMLILTALFYRFYKITRRRDDPKKSRCCKCRISCGFKYSLKTIWKMKVFKNNLRLWCFGKKPKYYTELVMIPVDILVCNEDFTPEFDRREKRHQQDWIRYALYVHMVIGDKHYYTRRSDQMPEHFISKRNPARLKTVVVNRGLIPTTYNRKTMVARKDTPEDVVQTVARLLSSNPHYAECPTYLADGRSVYRDMMLISTAVVTEDCYMPSQYF